MSNGVKGTDTARISLISGTKAQFIKMMPIAWELDERGIPYRIIDTGQHESITTDLRHEYAVRRPDISLVNRGGDVSSLGKGILWLASNLYRYAVTGDRARRTLFGPGPGIALVHGDTASTVLASLIAKRAGEKVMHIEAGLRSWDLFHPFPEELVRIAVMRMSDYLIAPSSQAYQNLCDMSLRGQSWQVGGNTLLDVVAADLKREPGRNPAPAKPYGLVTIHRMETLYNRKRLETVVRAVLRARAKMPVLFVQHPPTAKRLAAYGMHSTLETAGVTLLDLVDHSVFVHLLNGAEFVLTDGGSVQEEASYLGVPCLLMRMATERPDGIDRNVTLSQLDEDRIKVFLEDYRQYRYPPTDFGEVRPSAEIVDILTSIISQR